jgi:tripartite-type tricarboxylate transporter receptor subunit TctC
MLRSTARLFLALVLVGALFTALAAPPAMAQNDFYKGKTIRIIVCCSPGGFYDRWARLFARYLPKYIPGNPDIIVQNMPGAGSLIAANYVYNVAKHDGLTIVMPLNGIYLDQFIGRPQVKFDVRKMQWLGTQEVSNNVLYVRADSPYKSIDDIINAKTPVKIGATGTAGGSYLTAKVLEKALGAKFNIVLGYPGGSEVDVAVERGEVVARAMTIPPHFGREPFLTWHKTGFDRHLVQTGRKRDSRLQNVPTVFELMEQHNTPDRWRRIARVIFASGEFGRPFAVAPEVPADRVEILRTAYAKALQDPGLLAEAKKGKMDVEPSTGEEIQKLANEVMDQPATVVEGVKDILQQ